MALLTNYYEIINHYEIKLSISYATVAVVLPCTDPMVKMFPPSSTSTPFPQPAFHGALCLAAGFRNVNA